MLRGPTRHDGIPNKQSAKGNSTHDNNTVRDLKSSETANDYFWPDPDRDRQREQQRKERAQMLPDEKEIHASSQDLFQAPVKVKPSIQDTTSLQIRNSLGNFEPIRRLMESPVVGPSSVSQPQQINQVIQVSPYIGSIGENRGYLPPQPSSSSSSSSLNNTRNFSVSAINNPGYISVDAAHQQQQQQQPHQQQHLPAYRPLLNNFHLPNPNFQIPDTKSHYQQASVRDLPQIPKCNNNNNNNKNVVPPIKKPAPERADSHIEVETILKEMTDVTPPLTAIQTPIKLEANKKLPPPPRRSSKSEEKLVQSIIKDVSMAKVPSPISRMDSSDSSSSTDSDSDSESSQDSGSSASQNEGEKEDYPPPAPTTGSPTTRWNLSSFLRAANDSGPMGMKPRSPKPFNSFDNPVDEPPKAPIFDRIDGVSSTVSAKVQSSLSTSSSSSKPLDATATTASTLHETRSKVAARTTRNSRSESNIPIKQTPPSTTIPSKGTSQMSQPIEKISSLSASSSEDEDEVVRPKRKAATTKIIPSQPVEETKKTSTSGATPAKRSRPSTQSTSSRAPTNKSKSDVESSPETKGKNNNKNGQDKNKNDTIRKLFRFPNKSGGKGQSPNLESEPMPIMKPPSTSAKHSSSSSSSSSNRVSGKGKGNPSATHNGDVGASEKKGKGSKEKSSSSSSHSSSHSQGNKKHQKAVASSVPKSLASPPSHAASAMASRVKEENLKNSSSLSSSLIVRIPLEKLRRKPPTVSINPFPAMPQIISPSLLRNEKELEKAGKASKAAASTAILDSYRQPKLPKIPNSSRVGSSSDPTLPLGLRDHSSSIAHSRDRMCSNSERISPIRSSSNNNKKRPKKKSSKASPKKTKVKKEPTEIKIKKDLDLAVGEVSSANLLGYNLCDSITKTPPVDLDILQAPDSSLNPPHLPSVPQLQYFSYFEKIEIKDDLFSTKEHEHYLEEAKKLKRAADAEKMISIQASLYLEAGLYFILTGIIMERDNGNNTPPYTMYRDTLTLIQYISNRFRVLKPDQTSPTEAKLITLSMRCQALLFCKLFKMKMKETRDMISNVHEFFTKPAHRDPPIVSSSPHGLGTPSPHSPTTSPAGPSTILTPSSHPTIIPHNPSPHQQQNAFLPIPRALYNSIQKHCSNTYNCIMAHDTWEQADVYVTKWHLEEYFIGIDRHLGPLTLHSTLVDLVRYVRHGLQVINGS